MFVVSPQSRHGLGAPFLQALEGCSGRLTHALDSLEPPEQKVSSHKVSKAEVGIAGEQPLDLRERGFQLEDAQVVQTTEGDNQVELFVSKRKRILSPVTEEMWANRLRRIADTMARHVKATHIRFRQELL